jgi:NADH dehydrogenase
MNVVVLGAGYAGVTLVRKLEQSLPADVEIRLVDERETHLVQHLLHRAVRDPSLGDRLTIPVAELCDRATVRQAHVTDVDPDRGRVELADGSLDYDVGAVCLGARTAFYDLPGVEEHALSLKRLSDAERIHAQFQPVREQGGRVVVGGAGLSGIQLAGELAEMAGRDDGDGDDRTDADTPEILLVEQEETVAPSFPEPFQAAVAEELTSRGVELRTGASIQRVDETQVSLADGGHIAYDQLVWTGGITGPEPLSGSRPRVRGTLRLGQRTFGLGDAVQVIDANATAVPASAQTAISQAEIAATNVERLVDHERDESGFEPRLSRYVYDPRGWVVTVGDGTVAQVGSRVLRGSAARALKTTIGARYLGNVGDIADAIEFVRGSIGHEEKR